MTENVENQVAKRKLLRAPSPIEFFLLVVIVGCGYLLVTNDVSLLRTVFFSKYSVLILVVMILEYLVIKSADRSKVYQRELQQLQEHQNYNLTIERRVEDKLESLRDRLGDAREKNSDDNLESVQRELDETLSLFRSRK